jgi:hypothetical protein
VRTTITLFENNIKQTYEQNTPIKKEKQFSNLYGDECTDRSNEEDVCPKSPKSVSFRAHVQVVSGMVQGTVAALQVPSTKSTSEERA